VLVFGRDGKAIRAVLHGAASVELVDNLDEIVDVAISSAGCGDTVLFSPACASFDMFESYSARGNEFKRLLMEKLS
jgi:UDP-N-acetylmuramoylalanine--D-glutamate ligase